ncbi:ATP-binding cassette domain-containing protein, partial [Enterobacter hormaechei]|uniref:ATP-binding cassette domain-containing protein n=1 Tax=Enterobacter hormaechei TaxID=158836 RepID=UPI0021D0DB4F
MAERYTAENLTFTRSGRTLTDNVSLSLSQGELVTLIGPNGAGKSTLLRLLTGYLKPDSGGCSLAGKALDEWHPQVLSRYRAVMRQQSPPGFDWQGGEVAGMGGAPWARPPGPSIVREGVPLAGLLPPARRRPPAPP